MNAKKLFSTALIAMALLTTASARAAECSAFLSRSDKIRPGQYEVKFDVSMQGCPFSTCMVTVRFHKKYRDDISSELHGESDMFSEPMANGSKSVTKNVFIGDPRYSPRLTDIEITESSCP